MAESAALSLDGGGDLLVDLLLRESLVTEEALVGVRELQQKEECCLETALYATRVVSDLDIAKTYAKYLHVPLFEIDPATLKVPDGVVELFPENFLRQHICFPLRRDGDIVAMAELLARIAAEAGRAPPQEDEEAE
jgi:hypothetical protein